MIITPAEIARLTLEKRAQYNLETHFVDNPCRGIVLGVDNSDGVVRGMQIAWPMGRGKNSRNRIYVLKNGILRTEAADPSQVEDPRLIIYNVMRSCAEGHNHIVSNGDQTDTVTEAIVRAGDPINTFYGALKNRTCEPDAPNFTPRITGLQILDHPYEVFLSVLKAEPFAREHWIETEKIANGQGVTRNSFKTPEITPSQANDLYLDEIDHLARLNRNKFPTLYDEFRRPVKPGFGYCLTTYMPGAATLPSFSGEPLLVPMKGALEKVMGTFWDSLKTFYGNPLEDCRVSLAGKEFAMGIGTRFAQPINRYEKAV